eukprot:5804132-Amphidinium_carterae.1
MKLKVVVLDLLTRQKMEWDKTHVFPRYQPFRCWRAFSARGPTSACNNVEVSHSRGTSFLIGIAVSVKRGISHHVSIGGECKKVRCMWFKTESVGHKSATDNHCPVFIKTLGFPSSHPFPVSPTTRQFLCSFGGCTKLSFCVIG